LSLLVALLLGIVEGLTEFLPVSSTGHLLLLSRALGDAGDKAAAFDIVIQLGAILAVLAEYRVLLGERVIGLFRRERASIDLFVALVVGFVPTAVLGVVVRSAIKKHLTGPIPIAGALVVGGVIMIVVERVRRARAIEGESGLDKVDVKRALAIGIGQCFSMWPGASRSMCTIVAGQLAGLSTATAAEFSFLLGLPTLGAATVYEAFKSRHELFASGGGAVEIAVGLVTSFAVAWLVVRVFLRYLKRRGLEPFGIYRIVLGLVVVGVVLGTR
jgi:undecaprenyl-diphosphatase